MSHLLRLNNYLVIINCYCGVALDSEILTSVIRVTYHLPLTKSPYSKRRIFFLEQCLSGDRSFVFVLFLRRIFKENATDRHFHRRESGKNCAHDVRTQCVNIMCEYGILVFDKNHTTLKRLTARIDYSLNHFHLSLCIFLLFTPHLEAKMFNSQFRSDNFATDKFSLHV